MRASRKQTEDRIEAAEELLCAGVPPGRVQQKLADAYHVSDRQARKYITQVYRRWQKQTNDDAPHRREKIIRMAERFYAKALVEKQYTAAANVLALLAKMSGAFAPYDPQRAQQLAALGPVPEDPTLGLVYAQRVMLFALNEIVSNPAIDPERRLRWISEIGGKIGMTHAKALIQEKLDRVTKKLAAKDSTSSGTQSVRALPKPATARGGARAPRGE